jgi:hypothetical protein
MGTKAIGYNGSKNSKNEWRIQLRLLLLLTNSASKGIFAHL